MRGIKRGHIQMLRLSEDIQTHSLAQGHTSVWSVWSEQLCETEKRLSN